MNEQPYEMNPHSYNYATMPIAPYQDPFARQRTVMQAPVYKKTGTVYGILSLVFGCVAFLLMGMCSCLSSFAAGFALAAAVAGVILGILGIVQSSKAKVANPMAIVSLSFSAVTLVLVVLISMAAMFVSILFSMIETMYYGAGLSYYPYGYAT